VISAGERAVAVAQRIAIETDDRAFASSNWRKELI
jgi:hypothetical protein